MLQLIVRAPVDADELASRCRARMMDESLMRKSSHMRPWSNTRARPWRVVLRPIIAVALLATISPALRAQSRPTGAGRVWGELGVGGARQEAHCRACAGPDVVGGPVLTGAIGLTLPHGFGVTLLGRAFQRLDFEVSQSSRYVVALGQYTPPRLAPLTLSVGAGWGRHHGDPAPYTNNDEGAVLTGGAALRLPPRSRVALSVTADATQSIGGRTTYRPRLISAGISLSIASASTSQEHGR